MKITRDEFVLYLKMGREIEFSYNGKAYFLTPNYPKKHHYFLETEEMKDKWIRISEGEIDEILNFKFEGIHSLHDDIKEFEFNYIL